MVARPSPNEAGFTYVGLVFFVAILGLVGAATLKVDSLLRRAAAEQDLLEIGAEFSEALRSYAAATPRGYPTAPPTLQDLLKDPRFPGTRRHLRKIFIDPITGKDEWGIVYQGDKVGVLAVYSLSRAQPLKVANFDARFLNFENKEHLSEWKFTATGQGVSVTAPNNVTPPGTPGAPAPLFPAPGTAPAPGAPPAAPPEQPAQPEPEAEPPAEPEEPPAQPEPSEEAKPEPNPPPADPTPVEPPQPVER
ncbi:type II secretion system protein [Massilia sp. YIM B02769]|uniref:type II secretion system protein n=1 Tax=Massilia sp. YIM B02769 TaxID=3050129 RepID=UPI0025B6B0F5|nr:type II secretion system protein [Massilia sp. YIM B02769]MDN4059300.1 type II secretion system protein [Massilia sp. YIM B02769]